MLAQQEASREIQVDHCELLDEFMVRDSHSRTQAASPRSPKLKLSLASRRKLQPR